MGGQASRLHGANLPGCMDCRLNDKGCCERPDRTALLRQHPAGTRPIPTTTDKSENRSRLVVGVVSLGRHRDGTTQCRTTHDPVHHYTVLERNASEGGHAHVPHGSRSKTHSHHGSTKGQGQDVQEPGFRESDIQQDTFMAKLPEHCSMVDEIRHEMQHRVSLIE